MKKKRRNETGEILGSSLSKNFQNATFESNKGMQLFEKVVKGPKIQNNKSLNAFETSKGFLFEYIEAAKFNKDAALKKSSLSATVTDTYDPNAAADILIKDGSGNTVREVQAKFSKTNGPNGDNSAASSVYYHTGTLKKGHWGKYHGMQRLIRKDNNYKGNGSLLDASKKLANEMGKSNNPGADEYRDVAKNLTDELHHENVSSGGTTYEEIKRAYNEPEQYIRDFKKQAYKEETLGTATNMAKASFITAGIFSSITNFVKVYKQEESFKDATKNVIKDSAKSAIRGYATGILGTTIRHSAMDKGKTFLSAADASTIFAGGIIDCGVSLLSYVKGDIDEKGLANELVGNVCTSTITLYFSRGLSAALGTALTPVTSIIIYTVAGIIKTCIGEIINKGKLEIEELNRATALLQESTKQEKEFIIKFNEYLSKVEEKTQKQFDDFIHAFEYNMENGEDYDFAIETIVRLADFLGIELPYLKFEDFDNAMKSSIVFKL